MRLPRKRSKFVPSFSTWKILMQTPVEVFWVLVGFHRFRRPCCLHLHRKDGDRTTRKTWTWIFTAV